MWTLFCFTLRQALSWMRVGLAVVVLCAPAAGVLVVRSVTSPRDEIPYWFVYHGFMSLVLVTQLVPFVTLLFATILIGSEVKQRTLVYLITRRLRRATVLLVRCAALWLVLTVAVALSMLVVHAATCSGLKPGLVPGTDLPWQPTGDLLCYLALAPAAVAGYLAVFAVINLAFRNAGAASVVYLIAIEIVISNVPLPIRQLSIGHCLRRCMAANIPGFLRILNLPQIIVDELYPAGRSGLATLFVAVVVLMLIACALATWRELVPAKVSRD